MTFVVCTYLYPIDIVFSHIKGKYVSSTIITLNKCNLAKITDFL